MFTVYNIRVYEIVKSVHSDLFTFYTIDQLLGGIGVVFVQVHLDIFKCNLLMMNINFIFREQLIKQSNPDSLVRTFMKK